MTVMLSVLSALSILELLTYTPVGWRIRIWTLPSVMLGLAVVSGFTFAVHTNGWSFIGLAVALYRLLNLLRVLRGVGDESYRRRSGFRSSASLAALQVGCLGGWWFSEAIHATGYGGWLLLSSLQLAVSGTVFFITRRNVRLLLPASHTQPLAARGLPTLTVCVPARNENMDLENCLHALVASDYPKLEILVLDDQSHDRTPEIIRAFAHDGVRFVKGTEPPQGWQAKNWAYEQLLEAANGDWLLFCGVDVRVDRSSLRRLMEYQLTQRRDMVSLVPQNLLPASRWQASLIQPFRYGWELSLPRRLFRRPPILSTCWLGRRDFLHREGGFKAIRQSIVPESHFARRAMAAAGYSFIASTPDLMFVADKAFADQVDTAVRTRYPQNHRRPELVLVVSIIEVAGQIASLPIAIMAAITGHWLTALISCAAFIIGSAAYTTLVRLTYRQRFWQAWGGFTPALLTDVVLRNYSMLKYEFSHVIWKGRAVGLPMTDVTRQLPPLEPVTTPQQR